MNKENFRKKYSKIKLYKYVPLLEKQGRKEFDSRMDWMRTSLDLKEEKQNLLEDNKLTESNYGIILITLCTLLILFNFGVLLIL